MAHRQDGEQAPASSLAQVPGGRHHDLLGSVPGAEDSGGSESLTTVLVAFGVNVLVALAPWPAC